MQSVNKFSLILLLSALFGCAETNKSFLTEHRDAWFLSPDYGVIYCRANIKDNGEADPRCFDAVFQIYENNQQNRETSSKATFDSKSKK